MNKDAVDKYGALAAARKSSLMTQPEMAEKIGCTVPTLIEWEKDPSKVRIGDFQGIYNSVGADGKAILEKYIDDLFFVR